MSIAVRRFKPNNRVPAQHDRAKVLLNTSASMRTPHRAHLANILKGEAQTEQDNAGAQQDLLGKGDAQGAESGDARIDRVADDHPADDGQGEGADAMRLHPRTLAKLRRQQRNGTGEKDTGQIA